MRINILGIISGSGLRGIKVLTRFYENSLEFGWTTCMKTIHKHTVKIGHIRGVEVGLREINFLNIHQIGEHTLHILHLTGIEFLTKFKVGE